MRLTLPASLFSYTNRENNCFRLIANLLNTYQTSLNQVFPPQNIILINESNYSTQTHTKTKSKDDSYSGRQINRRPVLNWPSGDDNDDTTNPFKPTTEFGAGASNIATWNVRGLRQLHSLPILAQHAWRQQLSLIGVTETMMTRTGAHSFDLTGHLFLSSRSVRAWHAGVGFLLDAACRRALVDFRPISDRLATLRLRFPINDVDDELLGYQDNIGESISVSAGRLPDCLTVLQVYAPTTNYSEAVIVEFYASVEQVLSEVPENDVLVVMGDWNAKVGALALENKRKKRRKKKKKISQEKHDKINVKEEHNDEDKINQGALGPYGLGKQNKRGKRLVEFCNKHELRLINTWFEQPNDMYLFTWISPDGRTRNQIDYICVPQCLTLDAKSSLAKASAKSDELACVNTCYACPDSPPELNSDHNKVVARLTWPLVRRLIAENRYKQVYHF